MFTIAQSFIPTTHSTFLKANRFIVLGGHKCGTSSLHSYLSQHPEITLPKEKGQDLLNKKNLSLTDYINSYELSDSATIYGEVSSVYLYSEKVRTRIKENFPNCKLIVIIRNPVDRAFSNYKESFNSDPQAINKQFSEICQNPSTDIEYLKNGMYSTFIEQYLELFDEKQILILLFDDLVNDQKTFFQKIFQFINVDDTFQPDTGYVIRKGGTLKQNILTKFLLNSSSLKKIAKIFINPLTTSKQRYILYHKIRNLLTSNYEILELNLRSLSL